MKEGRNTPEPPTVPTDLSTTIEDTRFEIFGEVIHSYTRAEALADGVLIDVSREAREAGIVYPTAITAQLQAEYIEPPAGLEAVGQSREGRLWDVLWMFRTAAKHARENVLHFEVLFLLADKRLHKVQLKAVCGPGDTPDAVITVMLPHED